MRLVRVKVKADRAAELARLYENRIIPALHHVKGCRYAGLMQSARQPDECLSMTLWNSEADARTYEHSGLFTSLLDESRPHFLESSDFTIRLSDNLTLEYVPVPEEPVVSTFAVAAAGASDDDGSATAGSIWVRIVSLKLRPDAADAFKQNYVARVIPALRSVQGCRYVYLTARADKPNEMISVTSWVSRHDAEAYEKSGLFKNLLESQQHLLSELYQWKKSHERTGNVDVTTSEDVAVEHYNVVVGRSFA
ncbi:MAG: antibiotic biosynthesis monooxygenase [Bacteroidetes bacterium]|nr:antibiotic biosynthesis monooxygenase [Bacteroidota bacterium]